MAVQGTAAFMQPPAAVRTSAHVHARATGRTSPAAAPRVRASTRGVRVATLALEMSAQDSGGVGLRGAEAEDEMPSGPPKFEESIYALSTAPGMGGIAVIRVSGPDALSSLARMSKPGSKPPQPRYATLRTLLDPASGDVLDQALVLFFPGPRSFTGEDVVELHVHGGVAIVNSVLAALSEAPGLRLAVRGEFTRRAFLNGRMDLLEAEALNDLIHAETVGQQKQAMRQMSGEHRKMYSKWRTDVRAPSAPPAPPPPPPPRRPRRAAASPRRRVGGADPSVPLAHQRLHRLRRLRWAGGGGGADACARGRQQGHPADRAASRRRAPRGGPRPPPPPPSFVLIGHAASLTPY